MAIAQRQVLAIPLVGGLNTKGDRRAQDAPLLDIAVDIEFDDIGGLRTRYPFGTPLALATSLGAAITNPRRLAVRGSELLLFTDVALYGWSATAGGWLKRGDYLAPITEEETVFASSGDQTCVNRVVVGSIEVWAWLDTLAKQIWFATRDASGTELDSATLSASAGDFGDDAAAVQQLRLTVVDGKVLCSYIVFGGLDSNFLCFALAVSAAGEFASSTLTPTITAIAIPSGGSINPDQVFADVAPVPGTASVAAVMQGDGPLGTESYILARLSTDDPPVSTIATATHPQGFSTPVSIAVSTDNKLLFVRQTYNAGVGGSARSTLADLWQLDTNPTVQPTTISTATFIYEKVSDGDPSPFASAMGHIAAVFAAPVSGVSTASIFMSGYAATGVQSIGTETTNNTFPTVLAAIATNGSVTAPTLLSQALAIVSRPFFYDGHAFVFGEFAGFSDEGSGFTPGGTASQTQNAYYLIRDDGLLVARTCDGNGAGFFDPGWVSTPIVNGTMIQIALGVREIIDTVSIAPSYKAIPDYGMRAPQLVTVTLDDDRARRTVQLGNTLYIAGALPQTYDGVSLSECGFPVYPYGIALATESSAGNLTASAGYSYKYTLRKQNAANEVDRSTTASTGLITLGSGDKGVNLSFFNTAITAKVGAAIEVWRTAANPPPGAEYFLASSRDPSTAGAAANGFLVNAPATVATVAYQDQLADTDLIKNEEDPLTTDGNVEFLSPSSCSIIATDDTRIYIAGVPNEPNNVYYSRQRNPGEVVAFNDILQFAVPPHGGAITALAWLDGALVVFCETATFLFAGTGIDNDGGITNQFALAKVLSYDLGAVGQDAVVLFDDGLLVKTAKGWYVLGRDTNFTYAGAGPKKYDGEAVLSTEILPSRHQIRIVTTGRVLMLDTLVKQWAEWSVVGIDSVMWNGQHVVLTASGPVVEQSTYDAVNYGYDVETSWIKPADQQGRFLFDWFDILGEFRSAHSIRVRMASDYRGDGAGGWAYFKDAFIDPYPAVGGSVLVQRVEPSPGYSRLGALKIRLTAYAPDHASAPTGPCARLTSIALQWAPEPGLYNNLSKAQKV